jgi:hypothetical protein
MKRDCRNPCIINLSFSSLHWLKNWSYEEQVLTYRICCERYTQYAGDSGMLLQVYGKLTMTKLKSSRLSYNWVVSFPPAYMFNNTSKYEVEVDDSVVSLNRHMNGTYRCWSIKHRRCIKMLNWRLQQEVYFSHVEVFEWSLFHKIIKISQLTNGHNWYPCIQNSEVNNV